MGYYGPATICRLSVLTHDVCIALQDENGAPLPGPLVKAIGKRVVELYDNGIDDPDQLELGIMADALWADVLHRPGRL
jgi:hypothetical protein